MDALQGVDLSVPGGSLFVLLGPNGAGKTTLMRCVTGLVRPTTGDLAVFGAGPGNQASAPGSPASALGGQVSAHGNRAWLGRMGVLIENPGTYGRLDIREYLGFFGSFYRIADLDSRIRSLCGELGLELDRRPIGKLSQGNRQKLQLVRSLLHSPELLLWDEPTDHLDPVSQKQVLAYLQDYLARTGATALVATHRLEQMESAASHFGFIARGRLAGAGPRQAFLGGDAGRARLDFTRPVEAPDLAWLAGEFRAVVTSSAPSPEAGPTGALRVELSGEGLKARMPELIKALCLRDLPLAAAEWRGPGLGEVYERLVGG